MPATRGQSPQRGSGPAAPDAAVALVCVIGCFLGAARSIHGAESGFFFGSTPEQAFNPAGNLEILVNHLKCVGI